MKRHERNSGALQKGPRRRTTHHGSFRYHRARRPRVGLIEDRNILDHANDDQPVDWTSSILCSIRRHTARSSERGPRAVFSSAADGMDIAETETARLVAGSWSRIAKNHHSTNTIHGWRQEFFEAAPLWQRPFSRMKSAKSVTPLCPRYTSVRQPRKLLLRPVQMFVFLRLDFLHGGFQGIPNSLVI